MNKGLIKKGEYYDSVSLMIVSKELKTIQGVIDSSVVMGTAENRAILKSADLYLAEFETAGETDLLIAVKAKEASDADAALKKVDGIFKSLRSKTDKGGTFEPKSLKSGIKKFPDANLVLISVAGKYAAAEARAALKNNLHVMIFSNNVSLEDEIELKKYALEKELLVMGPDCGTAIINGIPLAFANAVNSGHIGIVAASGTGLQEVSSIISNNGAGISEAIGTGSRDVKKDVGGIMFCQALEALEKDKNTQTIVLVSKPPHSEVLSKISEIIKRMKKKVVALFLGADPKMVKESGAFFASTLEEAALLAVNINMGLDLSTSGLKQEKRREERDRQLSEIAEQEAKKKNKDQKYLRGLFSGGTFCTEAQIIFKETLGKVYSNVPLTEDLRLSDSFKSIENTTIDLGEDEFTRGRPHPMIDFSLRNRRIIEEARDPETAVILLDVVLGYGAHLSPSSELVPIIKKAKEISANISFICSVTGTEKDPQKRSKVIEELEKAGFIVAESNAAACILAGKTILKNRR